MKIEFDADKTAHLTFSTQEYNHAFTEIRKLILSLVKTDEGAYDAAISLVIALSTAMRAGALAEALNMYPEETVQEVLHQNSNWAMYILQNVMMSSEPKRVEKAIDADVSAKKQEWYKMGESL